MRRDITPADEAQRLVKLRDEFGFDAFKWRVGAECGNDVDRETCEHLVTHQLSGFVAQVGCAD